MNILKEKKKYIGIYINIWSNILDQIKFASKLNSMSFSFLFNNFIFNNKKLYHSFHKKFNLACIKYNFSKDYILPHSSFFINLCSPYKKKLIVYVNNFINEVNFCFKLGLKYIVFHPGYNLNLISKEYSLIILSNSINYVISKTKKVILLIENMSGQGTCICYDFNHISKVIDLVYDKSRIGVCFDVCHAFNAGYDLRNFENCENVFSKFENIIGLRYLKALHLSGSKYKFYSKIDRHTILKKSYLGKIVFYWIMRNKLFNNIPIILETRDIKYLREEIIWLYSL